MINSERILLNNKQTGSIRIANQFINRKNISYLFQVDDPIIIDVDNDYEDIILDDTPPKLNNNHNYYILSEKYSEKQEIDEIKERSQKAEIARKNFIKKHYKPIHPHIYVYDESFLDSNLLKFLKQKITKQKVEKFLIELSELGLYQFKMFNEKFCREFIEEIENFENSGLPVNRPNSMNNYGIVLDDMGFTPLINEIRTKIVSVFSSFMYPNFGGNNLDEHYAFIVSYKMGEDLSLDMHFDSSEVTLNVCLGKNFEGGDLYFNGLDDYPETQDEEIYVKHKVGVALLHIGKHRHGATKIKSGERHNLIIWCINSDFHLNKK